MSKSELTTQGAIKAINDAGALLVFPFDNRKEPASLWSHFHPRTSMRWEWDDSGDDRVANLWHLKVELSTIRKVVYTKWFRGRATYFSRPVFTALLKAMNPNLESRMQQDLSPVARQILSLLDAESPLSTKSLKSLAELRGKPQEAIYERAMKELWSRCLIVAFGEFDDGAFPSLAIGSTRVIYEDLWQAAESLPRDEAWKTLSRKFAADNLFLAHFKKTSKSAHEPASKLKPGPRPSRKIPRVIRFDKL